MLAANAFVLLLAGAAGLLSQWMGDSALAPAPAAPIVLPADPKSLLDPMDLDGVPLAKRTTHEADGSTTRNLRADGGDMKRTLLKLDVAALGSVDEVKKDASASGRVVCWVPSRLRTPENEAALRDEQQTMSAALESANARTPTGRAVRVSSQFGELW